MNAFVKMLAAGGIAISAVAPAFAETATMTADPMTMTCKDYSAMDMAGMTTATQGVDMMMAMTEEERTAAMAMTPEQKTAKMAEMDKTNSAMSETDKTAATTKTTESMAKLKAACMAKPDGTVMDAVKGSM